MEGTEKESSLNLMKYSDGPAENGQYCKSQELVLVSGLQEEASTSRSTDFKMKNEGKVVFRKKSLLPIFAPNHPYRSACYTVSSNCKSNVSMFTQRIMSAKLLGVRNLQNKLTETQIRLQELVEENRVLNALLKRQERALKKYEGEEAQLPQLIKTHSDEMRVLQTKYKQLKTKCHDMEQKLKGRDNELNCLREQHKHLLHLSKDKHLGEREKLRQQVEELLETVNVQEEKIKVKQKYLTTSNRTLHFTNNSVVGPLPAISKQLLSNTQTSPMNTKFGKNCAHELSGQEKNESDSNPATLSSSVPNSEYEGSEVSGSNAKISNSSSNSRKTKSKGTVRSKPKSRSSLNYDHDFEISDSSKVTSSPVPGKDNALPSIFLHESSEKKYVHATSESSKKSLTRQSSVHEEDESKVSESSKKFAPVENKSEYALSQIDAVGQIKQSHRKNSNNQGELHDNKIFLGQEVHCHKSSSDGELLDCQNHGNAEERSYGHHNFWANRETLKGNSHKEELSWEEIKEQIRTEHEAAKKKLESFSKVESDLLDFSLGNELDLSKKDALLRALNDIDRERNCENSDSDGSYKGKLQGDFLEFYTESRSPSDDARLSGEEEMKKRNGLVRDWFLSQYDCNTTKFLSEREKQTLSTSIPKGSDSSS
nr:PREDICTED: myosin-2 heavy chain isoform X3 [Bemisia tabaci]